MSTPAAESGWLPVPTFIRKLYNYFPLYYHPAILPPPPSIQISAPVLWIHPPPESDSRVLSRDVECLKWQAYIALRGLRDVRVRWDVDPSGGVDGRLPSLWVPPMDGETTKTARGEIIGARMIPGWADGIQGDHVWNTDLEGYIDAEARDESRAWVSLLEGPVHAALVRKSKL